MAVTARTLKLQAELRAELTKVTDAQTRALVAAWVDAWDETAPDLTAALLKQLVAGDKVTKAQLLRSTRLRKALAVIADNLKTLSKDAGVLITSDLDAVIATAGAAQASVLDSQLPPSTDLVAIDQWSKVDARQIDAIVKRSTQQITSTLKPLAPETYDVVRRELIRGITSGSNPRETARRMVARAEKRFNGQLGLTRALNVARTETLDAHRTAAALGMSQHADVLKGWQWQATLDKRTCPSCWSQHGSVHDLKDPGPLDHQQGRCARLPIPKTWADLGFDIQEPASVLPDAADAFTSLSAADQLAILGPSRHAAYLAGNFPIESWSVRKSTDGWRDSYHVAPAPQPSGGRSSRNAA
jgi:SPP1 gp7 family putative phage head morphogenesis protein